MQMLMSYLMYYIMFSLNIYNVYIDLYILILSIQMTKDLSDP